MHFPTPTITKHPNRAHRYSNVMKTNPIRERVAQLAAQLMHEHGIQDFSLAKRKAARQLGIVEAHHLPGNIEIENALKDYQALFHKDTHPAIIQQLRETAIKTMEMLADFNPYLTGSVLNGTANEHSDIQIELFTDNEKDVELYLLNQGIQFKQGQRQITHQGNHRQIPCFVLNAQTCDIYVTIQAPSRIRNAPRNNASEPLKRASLSQMLALVNSDELI